MGSIDATKPLILEKGSWTLLPISEIESKEYSENFNSFPCLFLKVWTYQLKILGESLSHSQNVRPEERWNFLMVFIVTLYLYLLYKASLSKVVSFLFKMNTLSLISAKTTGASGKGCAKIDKHSWFLPNHPSSIMKYCIVKNLLFGGKRAYHMI